MATTDLRHNPATPRTADSTSYNALWAILALAILAAIAFAWYSSDTSSVDEYGTTSSMRSDATTVNTPIRGDTAVRSSTLATPGSPDMTRTSTVPAPTATDSSY